MTMMKSISSPNQVAFSQPQMDEQSHASSMDESGVMASIEQLNNNNNSSNNSNTKFPASPQVPANMVDESTVYENASTDSSDIEEASEAPSRLWTVKETVRVASPPPPPARELKKDSSHGSFPVISLHDSQHSIVSGLTMLNPNSPHQDAADDHIDRLRAELLMLKKNVLKEGELSKDELVSCLDRIHEELGVDNKPGDNFEGDASMEGSDYEEGDRSRRRQRKKSKSLERGRKTPRSGSNKSRRKKSLRAGEVPAPPLADDDDDDPTKTPTSSNKGRKRSSGGSSRRKQRTIKAHSERSSRKSAPLLDSEDLRKILKGEGSFKKMSILKEERSQSTRSTKSSTRSKGRSSSLNPKNRKSVSPKPPASSSNDLQLDAPAGAATGTGGSTRTRSKPKSRMKSTNPCLDFSGGLGDTAMLKKKNAPRRKSAPMNVTDFDAFVVRQKEKEVEKLPVQQQEETPRVRGETKKKKRKMARRQSAPMVSEHVFDLEAFVQKDFEHFQAFVQQESFGGLDSLDAKNSKDNGEDATVSTRSKDAGTISTTSKDAGTISTASKEDEESSNSFTKTTTTTTTTKKKKSKKVKGSRRQSMSAVYTDPTGQVTRVDLSPARSVRDDSSAASGTRKKKKSRKPKNRRASMEDVNNDLSKPISLRKQTTFDDVVQRYQKQYPPDEEEELKDPPETPVSSKKHKKQSRRASISDFTFVSNHSYAEQDLLPAEPPLPKKETSSKKKKKYATAVAAVDTNLATTLASVKVPKSTSSSSSGVKTERFASSSARQERSIKPESFASHQQPPENNNFSASWLVEDESDTPVPVVKRSKMQQAKRKSSKFFSKTVAALVSPRSSRRKIKIPSKDFNTAGGDAQNDPRFSA